MNSQRGLSKSIYFWFFLLIASAVLLQSFQGTQANSAAVAVTYSQGALHVVIPYAAGHAGPGTLAVEVLDPEDRVVGRTERAAIANDGTGEWRADIQLPNALTVDDIVWQRVRYRFSNGNAKEASIEGTESISEILRRPAVHIVGQQSYLAGGAVQLVEVDPVRVEAAERVLHRLHHVTPRRTGAPVGAVLAAHVRAELGRQ